MDSPPQNFPIAVPTQPRTRSSLFWIFFWVLAFAAIVMGAYLALSWHSKSAFPTDIVWAAKTSDGSTWYENSSGKTISHADLSNMTITSVVRGGSNVFVIAQSQDSSTLYQYEDNSYTPLYTSIQKLYTPSANADGALVAFIAFDPTKKIPSVEMFSVTTKQVTSLANGYSPIFIHAGGIDSVLYSNGNSILSQTLTNGTWSQPVSVYSSPKPFAPTATITTDGAALVAFLDPFVGNAQIWKAIDVNPVTLSPQTVYKQLPSAQLIFQGSKLYSLRVIPEGNSSTTPAAAVLTSFASPTQKEVISLGQPESSLTFVSSISP